MATAFEQRLDLSTAFEVELKAMLEAIPRIIAVALNGTEHTHPNFVGELRRNDSPGAKFIRHAPDGVFLKDDGEVVHYDAKAAHTIERDAYETYLSHRTCGCRVLLFVKHDARVWFANIEDVRLTHGDETVGRFPPNRRFPVDTDGWIAPRMKVGFNPTANMSGTPYREIDFSSMNEWKQ